jgi:copper homeostasis protein
MLIEIAAFTPTSALTAAHNGADRIELCSGYAEGGLSPSVGTVAMVREQLTIPLHVMIRPRVGDFVYNTEEILAMEKEILYYKQLGVNGVVFGILNEKGEINSKALKQLIDAARPMSVTFHRAFDLCINPLKELDKLMEAGVDRVLTSGCKPSVPEGLDNLAQFVKHADNKIIILPGGGISAANAKDIVLRLGVKELHLSGKELVKSPMSSYSTNISLCAPGEVYDFKWFECNPKKIIEIKNALNNQ